ncbi:unnamed protein product [Pedinophyceae sp. YPF-701]|nr:unnamed protein product [Pedinophyceae sp. YPF-701]
MGALRGSLSQLMGQRARLVGARAAACAGLSPRRLHTGNLVARGAVCTPQTAPSEREMATEAVEGARSTGAPPRAPSVSRLILDRSRYHRQPPRDLLDRLREACGGAEGATDSTSDRHTHGKGQSYHAAMDPDFVAYPRCTDDVVSIMRLCAETRTPVVPFGAGTSVEGHVGAMYGGVAVDLTRMTRILEVHAEDMDCRVEAGVRREALNAHLRDTGLHFPVDPGADATVGGMASTRASGTNAVSKGTMRDAVVGLTAVLADGGVVRTGSRARKSSAGYDLTRLLVGSEGTLGVITEVALRLHPLPAAVVAAACPFDTLAGACEAASDAMQCGARIARVEILDAASIRCVNAYSKTAHEPAPTLFFEFEGATQEEVDAHAQLVGEVVSAHGARGFRWAATPDDRRQLWHARHTAYWAVLASHPGLSGFPTDVCVPVSKLAQSVAAAHQELQRLGLSAPMVGHAGDGNYHMILMVDPEDGQMMEKAHAFIAGMVDKAIELGGTCTGEHGLGFGKLRYLEKELGRAQLDMMHSIKRALDPHDILNPGKVGSDPTYFLTT